MKGPELYNTFEKIIQLIDGQKDRKSDRYQMVICLSVTSETRHDTRDQRESLKGRAPHPISG